MRRAHPLRLLLFAFAFAPLPLATLAACAPELDARALSSAEDDVRSTPAIDRFIAREMARHHREGLAALVSRDGVPIWSKGYGLASVAAGERVTPRTVFLLSSMSKPVTAIAVMQIAERLAADRGVDLGAILDTDVGELARAGADDPLTVRNPNYPGTPITLRMLMAHVSGIHNRYALLPHDYPVSPPDYDASAVPELRAALTEYLRPGGKYFDADNFLDAAPGTKYEYSSVASSIIALLVRSQTGMSFREYCRTHIFEPLGMRDTAWRLAELPGLRDGSDALAIPYQWTGARSVEVTPSTWENTFYPSASLRSTVLDYAKLMAVLTGGGSAGGTKLLEPETVREMYRVQYRDLESTQGLILYWMKREGFWVIGHGGANDGFRSEMFVMSPDEPLPGGALPGELFGVIMLSNGDFDAEGRDLLADVGSELLRAARAGELAR